MRKLVFLVIVVAIFFAALSSSPSSAALCNTSGYPNCYTRNGTSCILPGTSVRCVANAAYCEWGICICGSDYIWACYV